MIRPSEALPGTNLNSVWLEGTVLAEVEDRAAVEGHESFHFRVRAEGPVRPEPPSDFEVEATGAAFEGGRGRLVPGRPVRIIGRLQQRRDGVRIVGELVEPLVERV